MIGEEVAALLDWLDSKCRQEEKTLEARKVIAREQIRMSKSTPVRIKTPIRKKAVVLTPAEWRTLLTSGKTRATLLRETGCSPRTIDNQADALGINRPS